MKNFIEIKNGVAASFESVPVLSLSDLGGFIASSLADSYRILSFFAMDDGIDSHRIIAVTGNSAENSIRIASATIGKSYASFTPRFPSLGWFEREIAEQYAIVPQNHPWLKPIRSHAARDGKGDAWNRPFADILPGGGEFFKVSGASEHEVAVGPVHAGVIEPGHFRFQCMGEDVHHLEITLGYQHRGIEKLMESGPELRSINYSETAAGDSTIASALCYAGIMEALAGLPADSDAELVRSIMLELERIANHVGDLGALSGDVAFLPTASYCGRLRGEYLNMTAEIAGNRFGRNVVVPGGVRVGISAAKAEKILAWMHRVYPELLNALDLMFDEPSVLDRLEGTGVVDTWTAARIGMTGVAGKASGLDIHPWRRNMDASGVEVRNWKPSGDVLSRAKIRYDEIRRSHSNLFSVLDKIVESKKNVEASLPLVSSSSSMIAVSVADAWRGELVHVAITDANKRFRRYKITDPSFHNWFGLALALRGEQISNFPICNKSFNLSYCGHDL